MEDRQARDGVSLAETRPRRFGTEQQPGRVALRETTLAHHQGTPPIAGSTRYTLNEPHDSRSTTW